MRKIRIILIIALGGCLLSLIVVKFPLLRSLASRQDEQSLQELQTLGWNRWKFNKKVAFYLPPEMKHITPIGTGLPNVSSERYGNSNLLLTIYYGSELDNCEPSEANNNTADDQKSSLVQHSFVQIDGQKSEVFEGLPQLSKDKDWTICFGVPDIGDGQHSLILIVEGSKEVPTTIAKQTVGSIRFR